MSTAKKVFLWIFGASILLGLVLGVVNLIVPEAVSVSLNDKNVEGLKALLTALFSAAIPGIIFGLFAAGITAIFSKKKKD